MTTPKTAALSIQWLDCILFMDFDQIEKYHWSVSDLFIRKTKNIVVGVPVFLPRVEWLAKILENRTNVSMHVNILHSGYFVWIFQFKFTKALNFFVVELRRSNHTASGGTLACRTIVWTKLFPMNEKKEPNNIAQTPQKPLSSLVAFGFFFQHGHLNECNVLYSFISIGMS